MTAIVPAASVAAPVEGRNRFAVSGWLFLRLLAVIHLIAFVSAWVQWEGLIGPHGLLPAGPYFAAVREHLGSAAYLRLPSVCWWLGAGAALPVLCGVGVTAALLLFAGIAPALCLAVLWAAYLSLCGAGQVFFNFQWDALLLETTLFALFVAPWAWLPRWGLREPPRPGRLLLGWLLFRLMFLSGVVKLASGDPTWRDLTALTFHYETQPLPTSVAWFVHQLPAWWHRASCAGLFTIELLAPFCLFGPRRLRHRAVLLLVTLMGAIALTGNYTYFNLLTVALCLFSLDDAFWHGLPLARRFVSGNGIPGAAPPGGRPWFAWSAGACLFAFTFLQALPAVVPELGLPPGFRAVAQAVAPFRSLNNYGLFAVMTNPRPELIFEGSDDGRDWRAYEFPHKPGAVDRRPTWVAPHQPRLDWQLWFTALGAPTQNPWVMNLCEHLLRGTPAVLALLETNPFPRQPPRFVRVVRYEYHFTDTATRAATGHWWRRTPLDFYVRPASLP
jgi:hypothetical protein